MKRMIATNIKWNLEGYEETILPTEVEVPEEMTDEEEISNWLSDLTGFGHKGFELEELED